METTVNNGRHWYAFYWANGEGTYWSGNNGDEYPCGMVFVFDSKDSRDNWINIENHESGAINHRTVMDAEEAVAIIRREVRALAKWPAKVASYSVDRLIREYRGINGR